MGYYAHKREQMKKKKAILASLEPPTSAIGSLMGAIIAIAVGTMVSFKEPKADGVK